MMSLILVLALLCGTVIKDAQGGIMTGRPTPPTPSAGSQFPCMFRFSSCNTDECTISNIGSGRLCCDSRHNQCPK
ncbi:hypothetical protein ACF0H5_017413 [Mactra antiquata]